MTSWEGRWRMAEPAMFWRKAKEEMIDARVRQLRSDRQAGKITWSEDRIRRHARESAEEECRKAIRMHDDPAAYIRRRLKRGEAA